MKQLEPHEKLGITVNEYELFVYINSKAVPVLISLEDPWTLQKWHLKANLRLHVKKCSLEIPFISFYHFIPFRILMYLKIKLLWIKK